jgi:hypothetical protein
MQYTTEILAEHLGKKFNPGAEYIIETHRGAATRVLGGKFKIVGEVPDFSLNEKGTMIVLEVIPAEGPAPALPRPTGVERTVTTSGDASMVQPPAPIVEPPPPVVVHEEAPVEKVETKPIWDKPKVVHKAKTSTKTPAKTPAKKTVATDRGGKPLGGKNK